MSKAILESQRRRAGIASPATNPSCWPFLPRDVHSPSEKPGGTRPGSCSHMYPRQLAGRSGEVGSSFHQRWPQPLPEPLADTLRACVGLQPPFQALLESHTQARLSQLHGHLSENLLRTVSSSHGNVSWHPGLGGEGLLAHSPATSGSLWRGYFSERT